MFVVVSGVLPSAYYGGMIATYMDSGEAVGYDFLVDQE